MNEGGNEERDRENSDERDFLFPQVPQSPPQTDTHDGKSTDEPCWAEDAVG